ncbi:M23 family metallopeptidase [Micromonospora craniellae]|uniref:M23 family peptidase n=1 Tax=Micromonospora craniellae TaxID=2294034 RepID=A0A372G475_9ACTN|nr:M23 family metallopeptidase [Micromonospora craniellae]RFS47847.1 M23 family peptidase [Micromonospora craniellae]
MPTRFSLVRPVLPAWARRARVRCASASPAVAERASVWPALPGHASVVLVPGGRSPARDGEVVPTLAARAGGGWAARAGRVLLAGFVALVPALAPTALAAGPRASVVQTEFPPALPSAAPLSAPSAWAAPVSGEQPGDGGRFRWPVDGRPQPVRRFDPPPRPWLPGHRGVDLLASTGATIRAAGTGTVLFAGMVAGRPVLSVGHPDGLRTTYEPVRPDVTVGTSVSAGTALGTLLPGHGGCPEAACLHWGLRRGDDYLDPLTLLGLGRSRLLPLDADPAAAGPRAAVSLGRRGADSVVRRGAVSVGRAGWAAGQRAARTRPVSCTPARRAAVTHARRRS